MQVSEIVNILPHQELMNLKEVVDKRVKELTKHENPKSIRTLSLSTRAFNCLKAAGINSLYELSEYHKHDIYIFRNIGRKTVIELEQLMDRYNIKFKP